MAVAVPRSSSVCVASAPACNTNAVGRASSTTIRTTSGAWWNWAARICVTSPSFTSIACFTGTKIALSASSTIRSGLRSTCWVNCTGTVLATTSRPPPSVCS